MSELVESSLSLSRMYLALMREFAIFQEKAAL
jgi:hypothetical protein